MTTCDILKKSVLFVYNHPQTNVSVLPYISNATISLDKVLDLTSVYMGKDKHYRIKYLFKNYYGSGFLINNPIPNDIDASVGVYLGKFLYDGENSDSIASDVFAKISIFNTAFVTATSVLASDSILNSKTTLDMLTSDIQLSGNDKKNFQLALSRTFNDDSSYILMLSKSAIDDEKFRVNVPYVMENDEILIENYNPFSLYSNIVTYNQQMNNYLREFSVIFDFFIDIKNLQTGEEKRLQLVPEAFIGERLQYSRRMFVPNVFSGWNSFLYLYKYKFLTDSLKYLDNRIYNLERYIQIFEYNYNSDLLYIKMLKRLHQAVDAFYPLLSQEEINRYYGVISKYLNNEYVASLNDVANIVINLSKIASSNHLFKYSLKNGHIEQLSIVFDKEIDNLKTFSSFSNVSLNQLTDSKNKIIDAVLTVSSDDDYNKLIKLIASEKTQIFQLLKDLYPIVINKNELITISDELKTKILSTGYKRLRVYWLDENNIGVLVCPEIIGISQDKFKASAIASGLPNVNYRFITEKDLRNKIFANSFVLIRLNANDLQNRNFNSVKSILLNDKKNYSLKFKFILK